jgi:hypothetical protein
VKIQYINHNEINFSKWDECISRSLNGIVYAYSWYLNVVAKEWDALVGEDYDLVFPLIKAKKFGISYIYQPSFTQQLGLFSPSKIDGRILKLFIESIPQRYRYQVISFNTFNCLENNESGIVDRVTYQLDLVQTYFALSSNYNDNTRRNISRAIAMGVDVKKGLPIQEFIDFKKKNILVPLNDNKFDKLRAIMMISFDKRIGEIYAAYSEKKELCAAAFFIRSNGKVIYLSAASNELGKNNRAMFALVDRFINDHSESHLILDFEGSSIDNIARFYAGFGAIRCAFQQLKINNLPWYLKPFKR